MYAEIFCLSMPGVVVTLCRQLLVKKKTAVMELVEQNSNFIQNICSIFNDPFATKEQVSTAGVQLAIMTYGN